MARAKHKQVAQQVTGVLTTQDIERGRVLQAEVPVTFTWRDDDPLAVTMEVASDSPGAVTWTFARSLLSDALLATGQTVGIGNISFLSADGLMFKITWAENTTTTLVVARGALAKWLHRTHQVLGELTAGTSYDWEAISRRLSKT